MWGEQEMRLPGQFVLQRARGRSGTSRPGLDVWLTRQRESARPPTQPLAAYGQELFLANGCGACHTIRGTPAEGVVGPDLTHVGSRPSLGAGILPNNAEAFARWIAHTDDVKPDVHMPAFGMLPSDDVQALAAYLDSLE